MVESSSKITTKFGVQRITTKKVILDRGLCARNVTASDSAPHGAKRGLYLKLKKRNNYFVENGIYTDLTLI